MSTTYATEYELALRHFARHTPRTPTWAPLPDISITYLDKTIILHIETQLGMDGCPTGRQRVTLVDEDGDAVDDPREYTIARNGDHERMRVEEVCRALSLIDLWHEPEL